MRATLARLPISPRYSEIAGGERAHRLEIVLMSAGDDGDERGRGNVRCVQPLNERRHHDLVSVRKPLRIGELLAIVDDVDAEPGVDRRAREVLSDVASADDVERGVGASGSM